MSKKKKDAPRDVTKEERDNAIRVLYSLGIPVWTIAEEHGVTEAYVVKLCRRD